MELEIHIKHTTPFRRPSGTLSMLEFLNQFPSPPFEPRSIAIIGEEEIKEKSEIISQTLRGKWRNWVFLEISLICIIKEIKCGIIMYVQTNAQIYDKDTHSCLLFHFVSSLSNHKNKSISVLQCASFNNKQMIITLPQDEYLMMHPPPLKSDK